MRNYFDILGLTPEADLAEIKRSYRRLVKMYHPDKNAQAGARERFMLIHEAYEYLSVEYRRRYHRQDMQNRKISEAELKRKEEFYRQWVDRQQSAARTRAAKYAQSPFEDFTRTRIYKTAMQVSRVYNYIFIFLCLSMIAGPLVRIAMGQHPSTRDNTPLWHSAFPVILGLLFSSVGYYYLFIHKVDND